MYDDHWKKKYEWIKYKCMCVCVFLKIYFQAFKHFTFGYAKYKKNPIFLGKCFVFVKNKLLKVFLHLRLLSRHVVT